MAKPFATRHILLKLGGHFGTASELKDYWSVGMRFGNAVSDVSWDAANLQVFVDAAWTAAVTFHTGVNNLVGSPCFLDYTTAAIVGRDGVYDPDFQSTARHDGAATAGAGTGASPWNTSLVISLRTAWPRGLASNGRIYYPALQAVVTPDTGRIADNLVTGRLTGFQGLVNALNAAASSYAAGARLCVMSHGSDKTGEPPVTHSVNLIRSDGRLDSIERRENDQPVTYMTKTIT